MNTAKAAHRSLGEGGPPCLQTSYGWQASCSSSFQLPSSRSSCPFRVQLPVYERLSASWKLEARSATISHASGLVQPHAAGPVRHRRVQRRAGRGARRTTIGSTCTWTSRWPGSCPGTRSAHEFVWRHRLEPVRSDRLPARQLVAPRLSVALPLPVSRADGAARRAPAPRPRRGAAADHSAPPTTGLSSPANHPAASADLAELAVAGFDNHLYYAWPMTRLVVEASRLAVVHAPPLAAALNEELPHARVEAIRLGHGAPVSDAQARAARTKVRAGRGIPDDGDRVRRASAG